MSAVAELHPKHLAEAIENAVIFSDEKYPVNPTIEVALVNGEFRATGFNRYSALIDRRPIGSGEGEYSVLVDYHDARTLTKDKVRKVGGFAAKGTRVRVELGDDEVKVYDGEALLGRLERSEDAKHLEGDADQVGAYEHLYDLESGELPGRVGHMRLVRDVLGKFNKIKISRVTEEGKWESTQDTDVLSFHGLAEQVVGIQYVSATILQVSAGLIEVEDE